MKKNKVCAQTIPANLTAIGEAPGLATQALLVRLDIYEEAIFRTTYAGAEQVGFDEVSPFDLAAAFAGLNVGTGLLPRDTLWCRRAGREYTIGIYLPPATRALHVDGEPVPITTPLPALIFSGHGMAYSIYALPSPDWPAAKTPLLHAPFPNVYDTGKVCHGSVHFPACAPGTIHAAADLFFESAFNRDLSQRTSRKYPRTCIEMWRELAGAGEYPIDDLVEMGRTLGDLVEE